jgi:2-polyprenyl-3-methyl-5-hydroxy-6-metoxy-1,4-benzoquinol methylase
MPIELKSLYLRQALEPEKEINLRLKIPKLLSITDKISSKVQEQYEQNPYPRWMSLGLSRSPRSNWKITDELKLKIQDPRIHKVDAPKILIAGCGTGQTSIETASEFKDCDILAVDLSLNSLAYAKRKTEELKILNIEYMQADILDIEEIRQKFDIIESTGVLHHMNDPMAGWKALVGCLNNGGLMKIGLYSELARQHIVKIRDEIKKENINVSDDDMKSFRNQIINSEKEHHERIKLSSDFYNMSSIRDLLFHVQEYRFTIPKIKICLEDLGLIFCGFEHPKLSQIINSNILSMDNIHCLDAWEEFEIENPNTFSGMYQFWCQKI